MHNNVYIGSRYVPVFDGAWDNTKSYEPLTIVEYGNNTYTSKRPVPVGTLPTDTSYWALTGNYNGQIAHLQDQIDDNTSDITALTNKTSPFVTPEMFGAVGDGVTDDSAAIQQCLTYAATNNKTVIAAGNYLIASSIDITGDFLSIDFSGAKIKYTGNNYAVGIHKCTQTTIRFDVIDCLPGNGYCIKFYGTAPLSSDPYDFVQYINLIGNELLSKTRCISFERLTGYGWTNEIRIENVCFGGSTSTTDGIYINSPNCNGWRVLCCGFEGVYNGINTVSDDPSPNTGIGVSIIDCRADESFTHLLKTSGQAYFVMVAQTFNLSASMFDLSNQTNGAILGLWRNAGSSRIGATVGVINGEFTKVRRVTYTVTATANNTTFVANAGNFNDKVNYSVYTNNSNVKAFIARNGTTSQIQLYVENKTASNIDCEVYFDQAF